MFEREGYERIRASDRVILTTRDKERLTEWALVAAAVDQAPLPAFKLERAGRDLCTKRGKLVRIN